MANERYSEFIEQNPKSFLQGLFEQSESQKHRLGTIRGPLADGRSFIYAQAGAANLAPGKLVQTPAFDLANVGNCAVANANVGDRTVTVTPVTIAAGDLVANTFAEGYLHVHTGNSSGIGYKIRSHGTLAANTAANFVLYDKLRANLTAANSIVSLTRHQCKAVVVHPSPPTSILVGVPTSTVTANYFAWLQFKGPAPCLIAGTVLIGQMAFASNTVDGAVETAPANATNIDTNPQLRYPVGHVMSNNANTHYGIVNLNL